MTYQTMKIWMIPKMYQQKYNIEERMCKLRRDKNRNNNRGQSGQSGYKYKDKYTRLLIDCFGFMYTEKYQQK